MKARTVQPSQDWDLFRHPPDFSLVLGGPLFQLLRRAHLSDDALMMVRQRIIVIALAAWLPLLVLSALAGQLWAGSTGVPFLLDIEVHVRFLVVLPLLIFAELVVHRRMRPLLQQFLERNLIPENALTRFEAAIASAFRLRNSVLAEVLLIAFVYGVGILIVWRQYFALDAATWYATPAAGGSQLSLAGMWYGYVSLPIFQFLLCRWYFRLFIWARFLWQVSRIELSLVPTHPDSLGGLSFVSGQVYAFTVLAVAHGALVAGSLANRILFLGAELTQFKLEIAALVVFMVCGRRGPKPPPIAILFIGRLRPQQALSGQCETLIVGVCGFARITSVAFRVACSPSVTLSKPVHPRSGGGGGNRTRVQNASGCRNYDHAWHYGGSDPNTSASAIVFVSDLHVHYVMVGRDELVAHLDHFLERDVGLLQRDHHLVQVLAAVAGGKICRHRICLLLRLVDLGNRSLQYLGEVGSTGRVLCASATRPPAAAEFARNMLNI
jgi:hypothetical protein